MKIFVLLLIIIVTILFISKKLYYSAKRNLFKDQAAWSGKEIKINYNKSKQTSDSKENDNFLKRIADESQIYLEDQEKSKHEKE